MDVSLRRAHMFRVDMAGRHDWMMQQRRRRRGGGGGGGGVSSLSKGAPPRTGLSTLLKQLLRLNTPKKFPLDFPRRLSLRTTVGNIILERTTEAAV